MIRFRIRQMLIPTLCLLCTFPRLASAEIPQILTYQGRITATDRSTSSTGTASLTFSIYDASSAGMLLWTETHPNTPVSDGLFSVMLGSLTPLTDTVLSNSDRWLEVSVNGETITPRTRLGSVGYAYRVGTVDGATGGELSGPLTLNNPAFAESGRASISRIVLGFNQEGGGIAIYDPVDSKSGATEGIKRVEILKDGLIMFGATENDTNLFVAPNGDIIGRGQITMGENSSPGTQTSVLGFQNVANGDSSTIGGGSSNVTYGAASVIAGGHANTADGEGSAISGGRENMAGGLYAVISGGLTNTADGDYATVPGGAKNQADANHSYAAGHRAKALHEGSFVWADHTDEDFSSTAIDQFIIRANGGVGIGTDSPTGALEVAAPGGDSSVTLPDDALAAREILDEPGIAGSAVAQVFTLQSAVSMQELVSVTITIPAPGYIQLQGTATLETYGSNGPNRAYLQIDDAIGGMPVAPYYTLAGSGDFDSPNRRHHHSMHVQRTYAKAAGTYTFYLEAQQDLEKGTGAVTRILNPWLTAIYLPTAYGAVSQ